MFVAFFHFFVHVIFTVGSLYFCIIFSLFFCFCPRSVQQILLTGNSSHKCRSGTRKKAPQKSKTSAKTKQIALLLHFHYHLLLFCFFLFRLFFHTNSYLMVGHVWLPLPNTTIAERIKENSIIFLKPQVYFLIPPPKQFGLYSLRGLRTTPLKICLKQ